MASMQRSVVASLLFAVFGGPGILLVLIPWLTTRFAVPEYEPRWQVAAAAVMICAGAIPLVESMVRFVVRGSHVPGCVRGAGR